MNIVQETLSKVMIHYGFRHKYEVAEYFGVTPQALSTWLTKGQIPSKHLLKVKSEISQTEMPVPSDPTIEDNKTVIDYLINENVKLKNKIRRQLMSIKTEKNVKIGDEIKYNDSVIGRILIDKPYPFALIKLFDPEFSEFKDKKLKILDIRSYGISKIIIGN